MGILCETWPSWVFGFAHKQYSILWIARYGDNNHATFLKQIFPGINVDSLAVLPLSSLSKPSILACNGPFRGSISPPFGHVTCGGVSDGVFQFKAAYHHTSMPTFQWDLPMVYPEPHADIGAILGYRLGGAPVATFLGFHI